MYVFLCFQGSPDLNVYKFTNCIFFQCRTMYQCTDDLLVVFSVKITRLKFNTFQHLPSWTFYLFNICEKFHPVKWKGCTYLSQFIINCMWLFLYLYSSLVSSSIIQYEEHSNLSSCKMLHFPNNQ